MSARSRRCRMRHPSRVTNGQGADPKAASASVLAAPVEVAVSHCSEASGPGPCVD